MKAKKVLLASCLLSSTLASCCLAMEGNAQTGSSDTEMDVPMEIEEDGFNIPVKPTELNGLEKFMLQKKVKNDSGDKKKDKSVIECDKVLLGNVNNNLGIHKKVNMFCWKKKFAVLPAFGVVGCTCDYDEEEKSKSVLLGCGHVVHLDCLAKSKDFTNFCCVNSEIDSSIKGIKSQKLNSQGLCEYCSKGKKYNVKKCPSCKSDVDSIFLATPSGKSDISALKKLISKILPGVNPVKVR